MTARHLAPFRTYRSGGAPAGRETAFQVVVEQTDLYVVAPAEMSREVGEVVRSLRGALRAHIELQPEFATRLSPLDPGPNAPEIARRMAESSAPFKVGPMAAVAGTMAQMVSEAFPESGDFLVENGGDLYLRSSRERVIGILTDPTGEAALGVRLRPSEFPVSFCASSATIGHSLSLGGADLVVVRAAQAGIADAAATALANRLHDARGLEAVTSLARSWQDRGIQGLFAQAEGKIAVWGRMELEALG